MKTAEDQIRDLEENIARLQAQETPESLGWTVPKESRIPVRLSATKDAEWQLEEDELKF